MGPFIPVWHSIGLTFTRLNLSRWVEQREKKKVCRGNTATRLLPEYAFVLFRPDGAAVRGAPDDKELARGKHPTRRPLHSRAEEADA